jgi:dolichyl-phosphate beta-glucosyltransferase
MIELSIVIPAFNEAARLPAYLRQILEYCAETELRSEVIVVDDGSRDGTGEAIADCRLQIADWQRQEGPECGVSLLRHEINRGKGAAVRTGVEAARGELIVFADADGATPIREELRLREAIEAGADIAIGSRGAGRSGLANRTYGRRIAGAAFAVATRCAVGLAYRDTQCGFKMFRRPAVETLFALCKEDRYLFDVELLWWADRLGLRVAEVPVNWAEQAGGQVRPIRDGASMLWGLFRLRRRLWRRAAERRACERRQLPASPISGPHGLRKPTAVRGRRAT